MIQSRSPAVLYINKLSVLLVCFALLLLWVNFEFRKPRQKVNNFDNIDSSENYSKQSKYLKVLPINPFLRTHDDAESNQTNDDLLPTITALQSPVPAFSSLKLRLHGIVYQSNQNSYAMISMKGGIQEILSVNGEISEGLYLTKIAKRQVEVDYFDEHHVLVMGNTRKVEKPTESSSINESELTSVFSFNKQIEFLDVDKKRNPIRLLMIRRPYAVYSNGEFQGYKIMPGSNADQFKRLGFKSGDIITYLNGREFTGPGMKEFVIYQLTHSMTIDLTVLRDNQQLNINYGF